MAEDRSRGSWDSLEERMKLFRPVKKEELQEPNRPIGFQNAANPHTPPPSRRASGIKTEWIDPTTVFQDIQSGNPQQNQQPAGMGSHQQAQAGAHPFQQFAGVNVWNGQHYQNLQLPPIGPQGQHLGPHQHFQRPSLPQNFPHPHPHPHPGPYHQQYQQHPFHQQYAQDPAPQPVRRPELEPTPEPITFNFRAAFEGQPVEVLEEVVGKATTLLDEIKKAVNDCARNDQRGAYDNTLLIKQIDETRAKAKQAKTVIGVVGNTGAGKSSVINALLDEEKVVPTNCMRACTAVVTEISYNYDTDDKYRAEIEFITKKDWEDELTILFDDILNSGDFDKESSRPDTEAGIAWSKVKAVYPRVTKPEFKELGVEHLMRQPAVNILGTKITLRERDNLVFYNKLQKYIDSKEKVKKKVAEMSEYEKEHRFDMEYWPLIRVVRLYLKSDVLKTGAVLVDLPGVHDANAARAAVAERYMMQCSAIWVVAPITRAVDDKSAKDLLGATFKRQLYMDGGYSTVTFLCSKSDDISVDEAIDSLHLEDKASVYTNRLDELRAKKTNLLAEIKEIKAKAKDMSKKLEKMDDLKENYEEWRGQVEEGETVYAPEEKTKKRKRGSGSDGQRKAARLDSDADSDIEVIESDDGSDNEDAEEEDDDDERPRKALTVEDIDEKISELSASLKELKKVVREIKSGIPPKDKERIAIEKEINRLQNELTVYCIQQRNAYSKEALKRDFALGLREVDDQNAEEQDRENFDPTVALRDYDEVERTFPVFCVSARAYQKLCGRLNKDGKGTSFADTSETEIPALQEHCVTATVKYRQASALQFLNTLDQLLNSLSLWSLGNSNAVLNKKDFAKISDFVAEKISDLDETLWNNATNVTQALKDASKARLTKVFPSAVQAASGKAEQSIAAMDGYHWATYRALMRRQGVFTNRRNGAMNVNGVLCEPMLRTITVPWGKFFQTEIDKISRGFFETIHSTLTATVHSLYPKFPTLGLGDFQKQMLERQIEALRNTARDDINAIIASVGDKQKEINRMFEGHVRNELNPTYSEVSSQCGRGSAARMRDLMHRDIREQKVTLFTSTTSAVEAQLRQLFDYIEDRLGDVVLKIVDGLQSDLIMMGALPRKDGLEREYGQGRPKVKSLVFELLRKGNSEFLAMVAPNPADATRDSTIQAEDPQADGDGGVDGEQFGEDGDDGSETEREGDGEGDETDKENHPPSARSSMNPNPAAYVLSAPPSQNTSFANAPDSDYEDTGDEYQTPPPKASSVDPHRSASKILDRLSM